MKKLLLIGILVACAGVIKYEFSINPMLSICDMMGFIGAIVMFRKDLTWLVK